MADPTPEELAAQAAAQAAAAGETKKAKVPKGFVNVRILPLGDGVVSKGLDTDITACFAKGETVQLPIEVAQALEARGFAEIQA